jgi:DnaK suppressor protein
VAGELMKDKRKDWDLSAPVIGAMAGGGDRGKIRNPGAFRKDNDFRSDFLKNLTRKKEEVERTLEQLMAGNEQYKELVSADDFIEDLDRAEQEISSQTRYSILERKSKELEKIEILIRRILKDAEFGRCEACGKRIPEKRLLIVPEAIRCVPCQKKMEKSDSDRGRA